MKTALITGITGQDGSYLAELLLKKGYTVHGIVRRNSVSNTLRVKNIEDKIKLHYGDLTDSLNIVRIIDEIRPDEIYNLGAQSDVAVSFQSPEYTAQTDALGPLRVLESVRVLNLIDKTKVYQASTSELFGKVVESPQTENTPFYPRSPYGVAKLYAYWITINYRESYGIYACNGVLFNHESPRRGETFVTRKITKGLTRIDAGLQEYIEMGNLDSYRDWGHAKDYVEMQWRMLQQDKPEDYLIATGQQASVREFINLSAIQLNWGGIQWEGKGINEIGKRLDTGEIVIRINSNYFRPAEVETLLGDPRKAFLKLSWTPKITLDELISEMIIEDKKQAQIELYLKKTNSN
ncbi:GDP-mannose 4,6-dehydratase [Prochlorococcus marinus]|uniref:GDP-mannose 4,6-dehydratase n=1 Tax=Prochlorococcus marinus TaxID=1219 RepID=UPI0022B4028A|nr:GDP-mannose 4,6-dehydratase [Prochlorococcus marinus]